ncbi:hypothetical protein C8R44DRAFT_749652 [Mycena epipterygia]|nr:hypothetical protein C8R44DRAFT_749652 [Mycena epipterygia]
MRFISAIYGSSALLLAACAASVPRAWGAIAKSHENGIDTAVEARAGGDVFADLDLTVREEIEVEVVRAFRQTPPQPSGLAEPVDQRPPGTPGIAVGVFYVVWQE